MSIRKGSWFMLVSLFMFVQIGCAWVENQLRPHSRRSLGAGGGIGISEGETPRTGYTVEVAATMRRDGWRGGIGFRGANPQRARFTQGSLEMQWATFDATLCRAAESFHAALCLTSSVGRRYFVFRYLDGSSPHSSFSSFAAAMRLRVILETPLYERLSQSDGDTTIPMYFAFEASFQFTPATAFYLSEQLWRQPIVTLTALVGFRIDLSTSLGH